MNKNVTIKLDESLLKLCRYEAVENDQSLSQWITDVLKATINGKVHIKQIKNNALKRLEKGVDLKGKPLTREEIYDR